MAETFDGTVETAAVLAKLLPLCGGRWFDMVPDDAVLATNPDGTIKPFGVLLRSIPAASARDRGLGGERAQPHILLLSVVIETAITVEPNTMISAVMGSLLDFVPSQQASGLKMAGSDMFPTVATATKPSRRVITIRFTTTINL